MHGGEAAAVLAQLAGHLAANGYSDLARTLHALELARYELTDGERQRRQLRELPTVQITPEVQAAWDTLVGHHTDLAASLVSTLPPNAVSWLFALAQEAHQRS